MIFTIGLIIVLTIIFILLRKKAKTKKIIFIGLRSSGKTKVINYLEKVSCKTVPTLKAYEIKYKGIDIREELYHKDYIFTKEYKYIFFLKNEDEIFALKDYNITFVMFKTSNRIINNITYFNDDPSYIEKLL
ncbi:hypothetical protein NAPIS_ORF02136 [Vairimorpha apis BRL 01]|uniref:Signal recognition particle receptor subunit beta n=1 Tax=Vairimorpha apis BRL 01 TaxID=1037528 RepID=T0MA80_9MICR|nr:hypothetical protein NAPIS_ORF02136 [Vairimorpha apis BRL 01]